MKSNKQILDELVSQIDFLKKENQLLKKNSTPSFTSLEEFYETVLNHIGDPIFVKDAESRIILVNDASCEMFQLSRDEILGNTLAEIVPIHERENFLRIDKEVIETGIENIVEETMTLSGKETKTIHTRKSRFIDKNGHKYLIGIVRDITERKKYEMALEKSEADYKKLSISKSKLLSILAHDLKSPFNSIVLMTDLLIKDIEKRDLETIKIITEKINKSSKKTLIVLNNLLEWIKMNMGHIKLQPSLLVVKPFIENLVNFDETKNISFNIEITGKEEAFIDKNFLSIIIRNLISNASKFSYKDGKVTVFVNVGDQELYARVTDNGIGMSDETKSTILLPNTFYSSVGTANEIGTGLGLNLCRELVELHKGTIWVESEIEKGSTFHFNLPYPNE